MRYLILLALVGCGSLGLPYYPDIPKGCRNFAVTTWGTNDAPWNEVDWNTIGFVDEPMDPAFRKDSNLSSCDWVSNELPAIRSRLDDIKNNGKLAWVNWSTEEFIALTSCFPGESPGLNADVVSFDSYGGLWDWGIHTHWRLSQLYRMLAPGQRMGLVPEGHYCPSCGVDWPKQDYVQINELYFDWAMRHDNAGKIFAIAPFIWSGCTAPDKCIKDQPHLVEILSSLAATHPRCGA